MSNAFANYVSARVASILGDRFGELALPIIVLAATNSPTSASLVLAAGQVPAIFLAPFLGDLADRLPRRTMCLIADAARVALYSSFATAIFIGWHPLIGLIILSFGIGLFDTIFGIAAGALLPEVIPNNRLESANGAIEVADGAATVIGPPLAGLAIDRLGSVSAIGVNAASFALSFIILHRLPVASTFPRGVGGTQPSGFRSYMDRLSRGAALIATVPLQRTLQISLAALTLQTSAVVLLVILIAQTELGLNPTRTGLILAAAGVGGILAGVLAVRLMKRFSWRLSLIAYIAASGVGTFTLAISQTLWQAMLANFMTDAAVAAAFILVATLRQKNTSREILGRVLSASLVINASIRTVAVLAVGALASSLGIREAAMGLAIGILGLCLAVIMSSSARARRPGVIDAEGS